MDNCMDLPGAREALRYAIKHNEESKKNDMHKFDFSLCYDEKDLAKYGIMVMHDAIGNTSFELENGICLGYLLDMIGEPFKFAVHFGIEVNPSFVDPGSTFSFRMVRPVFKTGRKYWTRNDMALPIKVTEHELNWYNPGMPAALFRSTLHSRLLFAKEEYFRRLPELEKKFAMMQKVRRRSMSDRECIETIEPRPYIGKDGMTWNSFYVTLLNGKVYDMCLLNKELGDDYCQCTWVMYDFKKNGCFGLPPDLYIVQGDTLDNEMKVLLQIPGVRVSMLKNIIGKIK